MGLLKDQNFTQEITPGKPIKASQVQGIVYSLSGDYPVDIKINGTLTADSVFIKDDLYIEGFIEARNITVDQSLFANNIQAYNYKSSTGESGLSTSIIVSNPKGEEVTLEFENGLLVSTSIK